MGPVESQWGPGIGDTVGCRISYVPLLGALHHCYNEPLISTDLIKGPLLTGDWSVPWASGGSCWAAQNSSLGMGDQRIGRPEFTAVSCPEEGVIL